jgi:hypothetical protein
MCILWAFIDVPSCSLSSPDKDEISGVCVLGESGHQQFYHRWTVGDGFLDVVGMSWRRRTRKLTEKLVMEVVGTSKSLVV